MIEATELIRTFKMFLYPSLDVCLETTLSQMSTDDSFDFMVGLCPDIHCHLWDLIETGVCLCKSYLIN